MSPNPAEAVAARAPRIVREREVLRVFGSLVGEEAAPATEAARREVLKWATKQAGVELPETAWQGESFDLPLPGRDPSAIRLRLDGTDIWGFRLHRPDRDVPGRVWTTEVVLGHATGGRVHVSARLLVGTEEAELSFVPAVPGFVRQIAGTCGLLVGDEAVRPAPLEFRTREDGEALIDHLTSPGRSLPTIVLSMPDNAPGPAIDAAKLNGQVIGLAHVVLAHPDASWALTERLGKRLSVFRGAARLYRPGFDETDDPYAHPLVLGGELATPQGVDRTERWLRETAAISSLTRTRLGRDVLTFADVRASSLMAMQRAQVASASEAEQLATALNENAALNQQIVSLRSDADFYASEHDRATDRAAEAERQVHALTARVQTLMAALAAAGVNPDSGMTPPATWVGFADWSDAELAGRVVLTPNARRGLRRPAFEDAAAAARALRWLATVGRDVFIGGGGSLSNVPIEPGIQNAPCGGDSFDFEWEGRSLSADWHVKNGGNTRDPTRCLRIYYAWDELTQRVIVADMPAHRRTGAT